MTETKTYTEADIDLEDLIVGIETDNEGNKFAHLYGYGYCNGGNGPDDPTPCRFVEYTFFYAPLSEVVEKGIFGVEAEYGEFYKQYITDCNEEEVLDIYRHYDDGSCPTPICEEDITMDLKEAVYVVRYTTYSAASA